MEKLQNEENLNKQKHEKYIVHHVLAHSYLIYFLLLILGVALDVIFQLRIFQGSLMIPLGLLFLFFGTILIFWAQRTSIKLDVNNLTKKSFCHGPYCYTRSPTHFGLFFLVLGFGIIMNAFFVVVLTVISFIVTKFTLVKKQEFILESKYGTPYIEYKKSVKF